MQPLFVADVGNGRVKWGEFCDGRLDRWLALPGDDVSAWEAALRDWNPPAGSRWVVAGVHPARVDYLTAWLASRYFRSERIRTYADLPLRLDVIHPDKVGIDRLLNAVAVLPKLRPGTTGVVVDAGTALTIDLVTADGLFLGGAIAPGLGLMAKSLREHTALLPLVESFDGVAPPYPGRDTESAIRAGIIHLLAGGVDRFVEMAQSRFGAVQVFVAGGDANHLPLRSPADRVGSAPDARGHRRSRPEAFAMTGPRIRPAHRAGSLGRRCVRPRRSGGDRDYSRAISPTR